MAIEKNIASASIAEVVDRILDKGVVIDAFVRISLVGIELIAIEVRAVVSSVETWLKYAEAVESDFCFPPPPGAFLSNAPGFAVAFPVGADVNACVSSYRRRKIREFT